MTEKPRVLVVDDESIVRTSIDRVLTPEGFAVKQSETGDNAIAQLELEPVDIAFVDLRISGTDGMDVVRKIRERQPLTQVVVVTGFGTPEAAREAAALGVHDFLRKPVAPDDLLAVASAAWQKRKRLLESGVSFAPGFDGALYDPTALPDANRPAVAAALTSDVMLPGAAMILPELAKRTPAVTATPEVAPQPVLRTLSAAAGGALLGLVYVMFLPLIGIGMVAWLLGKKAWGLVARG